MTRAWFWCHVFNVGVVVPKARTTSGPDLALQGHQSRGPAGPGFVGLAKSRSPSGPGSVGLGKKRDPRAKGQGWPWVCNGQIDKKGKFSL